MSSTMHSAHLSSRLSVPARRPVGLIRCRTGSAAGSLAAARPWRDPPTHAQRPSRLVCAAAAQSSAVEEQRAGSELSSKAYQALQGKQVRARLPAACVAHACLCRVPDVHPTAQAHQGYPGLLACRRCTWSPPSNRLRLPACGALRSGRCSSLDGEASRAHAQRPRCLSPGQLGVQLTRVRRWKANQAKH